MHSLESWPRKDVKSGRSLALQATYLPPRPFSSHTSHPPSMMACRLRVVGRDGMGRLLSRRGQDLGARKSIKRVNLTASVSSALSSFLIFLSSSRNHFHPFSDSAVIHTLTLFASLACPSPTPPYHQHTINTHHYVFPIHWSIVLDAPGCPIQGQPVPRVQPILHVPTRVRG